MDCRFIRDFDIAIASALEEAAKDLVDLERLVAARPELDRAYVRRWIVDMMGEDDPRTRRWDEICARFAPGPNT